MPAKNQTQKTTSEKPVVIPLDFNDALAGLLAVKPEPKTKPAKKRKLKRKKSNKKRA